MIMKSCSEIIAVVVYFSTDEFKTSSGSLSTSAVYFANSWQVVNSVDGVSRTDIITYIDKNMYKYIDTSRHSSIKQC